MPFRLALSLIPLLAVSALAGPVRVERVDGKEVRGDLTAITGGVAVVATADGARHEIPLARVVAISFPEPATVPAAPKDPAEIGLVGGDRLIGAVLGGDERVVKTGSASLGSRAIPLDALAGIRYLDRVAGLDGLHPDAEQDVVYFTGTADRLTGTLASFERGAFRFACDVADDYRVPLERLAALFLVNDPPRARDEVVAALLLHDGSRLQGTGLTLDGAGLRLHPAYPGFEAADAWTIPVEAVAHMTFRGGDYVHLSDLAADWKATVVPFFALADTTLDPSVWLAPRVDEAFRGGPLRLGGMPRAKGVAVVSGTTIEIELRGRYESFRALVGVDDQAGPHGSVTFEVRLDDKLAWKHAHEAGKPPVRTPAIPLGDATRLTLHVGYGDPKGADVQDFANWAEALLVKR